jgi:16S rRNA (guanine1207-N2)-methyltransferase
MTLAKNDQQGTFTVTLQGQPIVVSARPEFPDRDKLSPATTLLAEAVSIASSDRVLILGCGSGALAAALAQRLSTGSVRLMDATLSSLNLAQQTLQANAINNAAVITEISVLPEGAESFDIVALEVPQGRKLIRRWLLEAYSALRPGGQLYLAGSNDQGIRPAIADAEALFGNMTPLGYKVRHRVARFVKNPPRAHLPDWVADPGIAPGTWVEFDLVIRGETFRLSSLPGIFAYNKLDAGTQLLLEHMSPPPGARVLDLGCGYGIIGLVAARQDVAAVDLVDANLLALAATKRNIARNDIAIARAWACEIRDGLGVSQYDYVVTNLPFHSGKEVDYDIAHAFIMQARTALKPGGQLMLVANRFLRYERVMQPIFAAVDRIAETKSYQVLVGTC